MKTRIQEIDALRSIAIIFIIFAHIDSFTNLTIFNKLAGIFAFFGLSIFFFISGFLMCSNNRFTTVKDINSFLKNRVAKIYPLYFFSIIIIYAMNKIGLNIPYSNDIAANKLLLLLNILGLQGLISENYNLSVWWFVGVILLYYFLFSIILLYSKSVRSLLIFSFLMGFILLFLRNEFNLIHTNVFNYYFIFIAGILSSTAESLTSLKKITLYYSIFLLTLLLISYAGIDTNTLADISKRDIIFLISAFIFTFFKINFSFNRRFKFSFLVDKLADSSYSIYLFHILILTLFKLLIDLLIPFEAYNRYLPDYIIIFIGIPFTLFSGSFIMIKFNIFYKKLTFKIRSNPLLLRWLDAFNS
ncbi:acyltransferase family protein [Methanosarcina mazei]|uniref:Acyltransferase 3 domain-containing protein n=1 Tax=Methanosarcina mazei TaxID=2209 RepID=A0A0F8DLK2_METMZ|nr:hypothetical protein DU49_12655 [Methanosarcina mazei]KKG40431.1 hypothetical protein DU41_01495 [Methanosarcina mazei]KKG40756.1 hypothetical protein DU35_16595 [Methanosarcina mazei]KKG43354.1 hypothetical protein DU39_19785 [Methanosarcina mazei]KKG53479.1 hypothetical protein DU38_00505 [Methanosarcina mazei]